MTFKSNRETSVNFHFAAIEIKRTAKGTAVRSFSRTPAIKNPEPLIPEGRNLADMINPYIAATPYGIFKLETK